MAYDPKFYWSTEWRSFRARYLALHPVCVFCKRPSTVVDHIIRRSDAPDRALDPTNCQACCKSCHNSKTAGHDKPRRSGDFKPVIHGCDADGLPSDRTHHWRQKRE